MYNRIQKQLKKFNSANLAETTTALFKLLGIQSERNIGINGVSEFETMIEDLDPANFNKAKSRITEWKNIHLLFQWTTDEIEQTGLFSPFDQNVKSDSLCNSFIITAVDLMNSNYRKVDLEEISKQINRVLNHPIFLLFRYGSKLALTLCDRRLNLTDPNKLVFEGVSSLYHIDIDLPNFQQIRQLSALSTISLSKKELKHTEDIDVSCKKSLDDFNHSELKTQVSRNRRYDWDQYPDYKVSQVFTSPYKTILEVIDQPYDVIYDDIDDYFEMDLSAQLRYCKTFNPVIF